MKFAHSEVAGHCIHRIAKIRSGDARAPDLDPELAKS
jgi:hypothetical protein